MRNKDLSRPQPCSSKAAKAKKGTQEQVMADSRGAFKGRQRNCNAQLGHEEWPSPMGMARGQAEHRMSKRRARESK